MLGYARILLVDGYSVLMPDARGRRASGREIATYGLLERNDIREWFQWLKNNTHPSCIFGVAESMGAAQLLQALEVEPQFCAVVAESSFYDFRQIAYDRMGQKFHSVPWAGQTVLRPVAEIALAYARMKYRLDLASASPGDVVAHTPVPILLVHGDRDSNIPVYHSRRIKLRNPNVELWEVPGADHCGAISFGPSRIQTENNRLV
jgi:uncharacterized protein